MFKKSKKEIDWLMILPTDYMGGGAEQQLFNLTEYLSKNGHFCKIIIASKKNAGRWEVLKNQCDVSYMPFNHVYLGYLALIPVLIKTSFNYRIKRTLTSQTLINALLGFFKRMGLFKNSKIIVRESNSIFHLLSGFRLRMYTLAYHIGYPGVDLVICQTKFMKEELLKSLPWMKNTLKVIVINNPINLDIIEHLSTPKITEIENINFIVAAGRLVPAKGFDILIKAFKDVNRDFPLLKLLILGNGKDQDELMKIINDLNLNDSVELVGFVDNVYPYFKAAKLCVMSSRIEGFPNVLLQMMSQNNKVVSTLSAGGIDEIEGIFTCETNNVTALSNTIKTCLKVNTDENRYIFSEELKKRTIDTFANKIILQSTVQDN